MPPDQNNYNERDMSFATQLARVDERIHGISKLFEALPRQIGDMEKKVDELTRYISQDYVRKEDLRAIIEEQRKTLDERKSGFLSTQGVVVSFIILILSALISFGLSKL